MTSVLVISRDVTGRKEAEDKLKERTAELEEAYNFLRTIETARKQEIHHRIKNNLQVISSLLDLRRKNSIIGSVSKIQKFWKPLKKVRIG